MLSNELLQAGVPLDEVLNGLKLAANAAAADAAAADAEHAAAAQEVASRKRNLATDVDYLYRLLRTDLPRYKVPQAPLPAVMAEIF